MIGQHKLHPVFQVAWGVRYQKAKRLSRIAAFLIDFTLVIFLHEFLETVYFLKGSHRSLAILPVFVFYFSLLPMIFGTTPGKKIFGLRIVMKKGHGEVNFFRLLFRETLGNLLALFAFGLGHAVALVDRNGHGVHDYVSGTVVVEYD